MEYAAFDPGSGYESTKFSEIKVLQVNRSAALLFMVA